MIKFSKIIFVFFLFLLFLYLVAPLAVVASSEIDEIQKKIAEQETYLKELSEQQALYQEKIEAKRKEAVSLKNQLSILSSHISKTKTEIKKNKAEITTVDLTIKSIQLGIAEKNEKILEQKETIAEILRLINNYDNKKVIETLLLTDSLSDVLLKSRYLENIGSSLLQNLKKLQTLKEALSSQEQILRLQRNDLSGLEDELKQKEDNLSLEKKAQEAFLADTRGAEWKFQALLAEAIKEQRAIEAEVEKLEKEVRQKLLEKEKAEKISELEAEGEIIFSWPVPYEGITTKFHDPEYPFKSWIGEHSGVDLRAPQGTSVRAAASGYVAKAKHGGLGYSYILIIHNDTFSTLYGHISQILVEEGTYVKRGEVIAKSGGLPGTTGAGRFSTGPHLHFEVRKNSLPTNPLDYLI